ncbi:MAG: DUF4340 domain-containing protein [Spirochaetes bacterium]|nr:DUF4340 domain-containing protein [Spirochaetota bacterium]
MQREKKNIILAAVVGVTFILAFLVNDPFLFFESNYEKSKPLFKGRAERVKKVTTTDGMQRRIFTRSTDGWSLEGTAITGVQKADASKVDTGLKNVFEARKYQEVSSNKDKQGEYEVRDTDFQIVLEGENGEKIAQAFLGKFSGSGNASFIRLSDDTAVYAVKGFLRGDWNQEVDMYRDRTILKIAKENITEIYVTGKQQFTLKSDPKGVLTLDPVRATDKARVSTFTSDLTDLTGVKFWKETVLPPAYGKIKIVLSAGIAKEIEVFGPTKEQEFVVRSTDAAQPLTAAKSKIESLFLRLEDLVDKVGTPTIAPK